MMGETVMAVANMSGNVCLSSEVLTSEAPVCWDLAHWDTGYPRPWQLPACSSLFWFQSLGRTALPLHGHEQQPINLDTSLGHSPSLSLRSSPSIYQQCAEFTLDSTWLKVLCPPGGITGLSLEPAVDLSAVKRWIGLLKSLCMGYAHQFPQTGSDWPPLPVFCSGLHHTALFWVLSEFMVFPFFLVLDGKFQSLSPLAALLMLMC